MKLAREFGIEVSDQPVEAVFQPCDGNSFLGEEYDVERIADRIVGTEQWGCIFLRLRVESGVRSEVAFCLHGVS